MGFISRNPNCSANLLCLFCECSMDENCTTWFVFPMNSIKGARVQSNSACGVTSPPSRCTCASASASSQYQQAVFHRSVWQKHMRLEQNPPKTTTLSWGIMRSPNIRGKQEDAASSIIQQESTPKKNTGTRCTAIVRPHWHRKNRMWRVSMPEVTGEPLVPPAWKNFFSMILFKQLLHLFMLTFFCLWAHLEAGKCVDYLAWASSASSMMGIDIMKLWIDLKLQGLFWLFDCS